MRVIPRLYPILDTALLEKLRFPAIAAAEAMLEAGAGILQWRCKGHVSRHALREAERIAQLCWQSGALFVVNDRADIARILHAGVHVGQDDLPPAVAREIAGPEALLGFSTHNANQLMEAADAPADYLALGPIFGTTSKANPDPVVGLENLRAWRLLTGRPLVAIGGIDRLHARSVLAAGADSIALIRDLIPEEPSKDSIRRRTEEWLHLLSP
ncbi:MAG: thiamine phosphate synthase [Bryobacterales bacterium]|nr:thiamine phosphate synthase [Bryobacterales bacterium]